VPAITPTPCVNLLSHDFEDWLAVREMAHPTGWKLPD